MRFVILLAVVFGSASAVAANWVSLPDFDHDGRTLAVDRNSIVRIGGLSKAWFKTIFEKAQLIPAGADKSNPKVRYYSEQTTLFNFRCYERTYTIVQADFRDSDRNVVATFKNPSPYSDFSEVSPESRDEAMLDAVCNFEGHAGAEATELPPLQQAPPPRVSGSPAKMTRPVNPDDYYPPGSRRREEQGSPVVQVCVGPSGKLLRKPVITDTSGFPDLDNAAIKVAKDTQYAAGTENGTALPESCLKFKIKFALSFN